MLILTDRAAAVSDKGTSYRYDPDPDDVTEGWGVQVGDLLFSFFDNPNYGLPSRPERRPRPSPHQPHRLRADPSHG